MVRTADRPVWLGRVAGWRAVVVEKCVQSHALIVLVDGVIGVWHSGGPPWLAGLAVRGAVWCAVVLRPEAFGRRGHRGHGDATGPFRQLQLGGAGRWALGAGLARVALPGSGRPRSAPGWSVRTLRCAALGWPSTSESQAHGMTYIVAPLLVSIIASCCILLPLLHLCPSPIAASIPLSPHPTISLR